ncbi:hypothetical protein FRC04_006649 [Tulasnella sp. 424]|nr:hypothetical protein FRC04_006649 [Tulasnella sp. 424]KAG8975321.1 hypothetical protein FRC05_005880 [Tulasnella sp. 425]
MAIPITLVPRLPLQVLAEADDAAAGRRPQQQVVHIRAFFGTDLGETIAPRLPLGWEGCTHPQGIVYYFHAHDRVLTHVDPRLPENLEQLQLALRKIEALLPPGWRERNIHIVLSFTPEELRKRLVQYYLADYSTQLVFWVHHVDLRDIGLQPYQNMACLKSMLLSPFWTHVYHFSSTTSGLNIETEIRLLKNRLNFGRVPGTTLLVSVLVQFC